MIEVDFYGKDTCRCDMCDRGAIIRLMMGGENKPASRLALHNVWLCENHLKELYQKIDPLRVLVMTGKNIK
jgi:queuine/archaeosine tRNA-ribosyltransferase